MQSFRTIFKLAWRNVHRNWRHSLATMLAIASGFMAVSLFDGFLTELEDRNYDGFSTRGMMGHVLVEKQGAQLNYADDPWQYSMTVEDQKFLADFLQDDPAFVRRVRFLNMTGMVNAGKNNSVFIGFGFDVAEGLAVRGERWAWNATAGKPVHLMPGPAMMLGGGLAKLLDCDIPVVKDFVLRDGNYKPEERPIDCHTPRMTLSATTEAAQVNAIDLPVAGTIDAGFQEADKRALDVPLAEAQRLLDTDKITLMSIELKSQSDSKEFVKRLQDAAAAKGYRFDVMPWMDHNVGAYIRGGMQILGVFRNLFMLIVVTIGVMSVANTMMKSVSERTREIGTLRSLGFFRRDLVTLFACEGAFLSMIACTLGLLMTVVAAELVGLIGLKYKAGILSMPIELQVQNTPIAWAISAVVLIALATGTAWFCARRASRMVIADALRHV